MSADQLENRFHQKLNGTLPTDPKVDRTLLDTHRYSGLFGLRSVGPVGDFLDKLVVKPLFYETLNSEQNSYLEICL